MTHPGLWMMTQTWEHLLFLHWKIAHDELVPFLPKELELDTYHGQAWLTILPFQVRHQRLHWLPEIPLFSTFLELNIRTYVTYQGRPGVYFFSLDVNHPLSVIGAKLAGLPFQLAKMDVRFDGELVSFNSKRRLGRGDFCIEYEPGHSPSYGAEEGSLNYWLLERYCLFSKLGGLVLRGEICHDPWEISEANVQIAENSAAPFELQPEPDLVHYCARKKAFILPLII